MVPDGYFKVWVNNDEELRAVLEELEAIGIFWHSGAKATDYIPRVIPLGLEIGYHASRNAESSRSLTCNHDFDMWKSVEHFDAGIYTIDDIVFVPPSGDCDSVFSAISF